MANGCLPLHVPFSLLLEKQSFPCAKEELPWVSAYPDIEVGHHHISCWGDDGDVLTDDPLLHIHYLA